MMISFSHQDVKQISGKRKKPALSSGLFKELCRRSPNLPHSFPCSTIGPARLNFRVRDGNGCDPRGMVTGKLKALGGLFLPQPDTSTDNFFRTRYGKLAPCQNLNISQRNRLVFLTRLVELSAINCTELILWTSRTGD